MLPLTSSVTVAMLIFVILVHFHFIITEIKHEGNDAVKTNYSTSSILMQICVRVWGYVCVGMPQNDVTELLKNIEK